MREIKCNLSIGYPTAEHNDVIEVEDDATNEDIEREVEDWAHNYIEWSWEEAK
jgi:hypothetical protein